MTEEFKLLSNAVEYANHHDWFEFSANVDEIGNAIKIKMKKAYIAGATEATKELREKNNKLEEQITKWKEDYIALENLKDYQIKELQEKKTCWKNCEYANPKAELIQSYISEKEKVKELQKKVENLQKYLDTRNCFRECAETWEKLTEAKEIIREIPSRPDGETNYETRAKAEAFIKEANK